MNDIWSTIRNMVWNLTHRVGFIDIVDILIVAVIIYELLLLTRIPDIQPQKNEQNGCLRFDRNTDNGQTGQTDLYLLTEKSFHHITLRYPAAEKDIYDSYIEYMINTMETSGTDLG